MIVSSARGRYRQPEPPWPGSPLRRVVASAPPWRHLLFRSPLHSTG